MDQANEVKLLDTLNFLINDTHYCLHCVSYYGSLNGFKKMIQQQNINLTMNDAMKRVRMWINVVSILNYIVVFFTFGGPLLISVVGFFSSLCLFASIFMETPKHALYLEFSIMIVTAVVLMNSVHAIVVTILETLIEKFGVQTSTKTEKNE